MIVRRIVTEDRGMTLTEVLIAIFLLSIVSAVFMPTLASTLDATRSFENAARANDVGRLALERLDREFRSAQEICDPTPGLAGDRLEFETRAYTSATTPSGVWELIYNLNGTTLERSADDGVTWTTVAEGVANATVVDDLYNAEVGRPLGTVGVPIFTTEGGVVGSYPSAGRVVTVRLWTDVNPLDELGAALTTTEMAGRNIWTPNGASC